MSNENKLICSIESINIAYRRRYNSRCVGGLFIGPFIMSHAQSASRPGFNAIMLSFCLPDLD